MKALVTGGTGFIGSHVVREFVRCGDSVTVLTRDPSRLPEFLSAQGVQCAAGSIDDTRLLSNVLPGHDACVHCAIWWEEDQPDFDLRDVCASVGLFQSAAKAGVPQLLYTSSTAVHRPYSGRMSEASCLAPDDEYGAAKAATEMFLFAVGYQTGMRANVIRPGPTVGGPAGPGAAFRCDHRFRRFVAAALAGMDIVVQKDEGRQFIGADDLAKACAAILHSGANRETYLCVAKHRTTWERVAQMAAETCGSKSRVIAENPPTRCDPPIFDVGKLERDFGLSFDAEDALRETIAYLVENTRQQS